MGADAAASPPPPLLASMAPEAMMALPAPTTLIDALPYVDSQYNDAKMKKRVDQLVQAEMETFAPRDYVAHLPQYEPNFEDHPVLQAEWMRICDQQPMSRIDTSRYALDPPPVAKQADPQAWRRAVENAEAQHEHQNTRLNNLELLQKHGANLWLAHIDSLTAASAGLASVQSDLASQVEAVNRKRKVDQMDVGPHLTRLESEWVGAVKKNLEIEGHCMRMENECAALQKRLAARGGHG